ncbi:DUF1080 domain-containing protein, partial [bacterium]
MIKSQLAALGVLLLSVVNLSAQETKISVDASKVLNRVTPWLAGSCIEDVNHEIYGGLYDQKIFGESFEEPAPNPKFKGWKTLGGDWVREGAGVKVGADAGGKLESESPAFGDGTVSAEVRFLNVSGNNAGLLVRLSNAGVGADAFDGYEVSLDPNGKRLILGKHRHDWQPLQNVAVNFEPRDWTRLKVELEGARIRIYVGESTVPAIDFTDSSNPLLLGTFALRTWNSDVAFRQIQSAKSGEILRAVETGVAEVSPLSVSRQWDAVTSGNATVSLSRVEGNAYNGDWAQKIERGAGAGVAGIANRGLNRWGIAVKRGQRLGGRLYLRGSGLGGAVTVSLQSFDGSLVYASQKIGKVGADWAKYPISLSPSADDSKARFVVSIDQPGTLWVDQVVLTGTGAAQFKGLPLRADIARQMQQQGIKFLRYGGTMVNAPGYRWKKMIGDPDKRPPYRGHWYPHSTNGFGIEEFLRFCEAAGFEAAFAINVEETAQDAADLVEYVNGPVSTPWGRRRAENGHPKPYNVRWIQLGNEEVIWGDNAADYDHYVDRFNVLSAAMHAKDARL